MQRDELCDGCAYLDFADPVNKYDVYSASCCDPEKPAMGKRRVISVMQTARPLMIHRPAWCRGKRPK